MKTILIYLTAAVMAGGLVYGGMLLRDHKDHPSGSAGMPANKLSVSSGGKSHGASLVGKHASGESTSEQPQAGRYSSMAGSIPARSPQRKKWKPKPRPIEETNKWLFYQYALPWITQAECGPIPAPCCHLNPHDPGGLTCIGVSLKSSGAVLKQIINDSWRTCRRHNHTKDSPFICENLPAKKLIENYYYEQYFRPFEACPFWTAFQLMDSQILSGQGARLFQRSVGLTADNVFGSASKAACPLFDAQVFRAERLKRFRSLNAKPQPDRPSLCDRFCEGWEKRLDKLAKYVKKEGGA